MFAHVCMLFYIFCISVLEILHISSYIFFFLQTLYQGKKFHMLFQLYLFKKYLGDYLFSKKKKKP